MVFTGFAPWQVRPHELLILNFLFRVLHSPSVDKRARNKHVLFHRAHNIVLFSRYEKVKFEALDRWMSRCGGELAMDLDPPFWSRQKNIWAFKIHYGGLLLRLLLP